MTLNFDASKIELTNNYELIEDGTYTAIIADSEWKENKAGTGGYLNLKIEIIEGKNKGRFIFDMLNLQNQNPKAVEIAEQTLAKICNATGKLQVNESSDLYNIPLSVKIGTQPAQNGYEAQNKVKNYASLKDVKVSTQSPKQAEAKTSTPPWKK
jgi:hypothetical protein